MVAGTVVDVVDVVVVAGIVVDVVVVAGTVVDDVVVVVSGGVVVVVVVVVVTVVVDVATMLTAGVPSGGRAVSSPDSTTVWHADVTSASASRAATDVRGNTTT